MKWGKTYLLDRKTKRLEKNAVEKLLKYRQNYRLSAYTASWKESMIDWLSDLLNCNRSAAKISHVLCSTSHTVPSPFAH